MIFDVTETTVSQKYYCLPVLFKDDEIAPSDSPPTIIDFFHTP